ncbi:pilus assembly protein PilM, partial [Vibrio sp. M260118]|uniref:pilus assembly protein PilM n=1 Tax=Vibrio sp. M260118 TaxID=3020896 RepID=UPI002F3EB3F7
MGKSLVTGIEIARHSIKAVVLKPNKGTFVLVDYQELPIEAGILPDNHMSNYQKIVKKLKELRKSLPRFSNKVAFSIPDSAVISKVLQIDSDLE